MLPPFDERGNLPPGVYETNWTEFCNRFGFNSHRQNILVGLQMALQLLAQANCQRVYIGGSFVTDKEYPNDFDGCYDDMNIDYDLLDPIFDEELVVQKKDLVENYSPILYFKAACSVPISEETSEGAVRFLQTDRDGNPKGIIALDPRDLLK